MAMVHARASARRVNELVLKLATSINVKRINRMVVGFGQPLLPVLLGVPVSVTIVFKVAVKTSVRLVNSAVRATLFKLVYK